MLKVVLLVALIWFAWRWLKPQLQPKARGRALGRLVRDEMEARAILGVPAGADAAAIRAAHRRLVMGVHPDRGGSAELARRVNAARDVLLREGR